MQIEVQYIDSEIARPADSEQSVEIRSVHIEQAATCMHDAGNLNNLILKNAECVGIGEHQCSHFLIHGALKTGQVHGAFSV